MNLDKLDRICDISLDEIQSSVLRKEEPEWSEPWKSLRVLNETKARKRFKNIPRFERVIDRMVENLKRSHPIKVRFTRNVGAEYIFFTSKKDAKKYHDIVHVPHPCRFESNKTYYKTYVHELGHAACSRNRLCIKFSCKDEEEVAVESCAVIVSFLLGINVWNDSIGYIQNRSYGTEKKNDPDILYIRTKRQWKNVRNKTKRIIRYLLTGRERRIHGGSMV